MSRGVELVVDVDRTRVHAVNYSLVLIIVSGKLRYNAVKQLQLLALSLIATASINIFPK
jgi:hypothetical protein